MPQSIILITGANRGIGLELTNQFAQNDWQVLACCRNPADAEISTDESVSGLKNILQRANLEQSGQFIEYNGNNIPW